MEEQLRKGKSLAAIGELAGKDASTVRYWLKKFGLRAVNSGKHAARGGISRDVLEALVDRGLSYGEIAAEVDRSPATVRHWLTSHGLATRHAERRRELARARRDGLASLVCWRHGKTKFLVETNGRIRCLKCRSEYVARRRRKMKEILVAEAGGKCQVCGYDRFIGALHFHHVDPATKRFGLAAGGVARSIAAARAEASKCVLLCSNCHAEVETGMISVTLDAGSGSER